MKAKSIIIFALTLLITLIGLTIKPEATMSETQSMEQTQAIKAFGIDLFKQVWQENNEENIFIAPASVNFALAMLYNGAAGETAKEMSQVLHTNNLSLSEINQQNQKISQILQEAEPEAQLAIANSLWLRQDFSFKPEFLENNRTFYDATITELDFSSPRALTEINDWVATNTSGKITEIIDSIDPQQILFLINAVYFKSAWTHKFAPEKTTERPFYLTDGGEKSVPMMSQTTEFPYLETDTFQAISLPYGETKNLSMYVFLPKPDSNLAEFLAQFNLENWDQWLSQLRNAEVKIDMPSFKIEYEIGLRDILANLGMKQAFQPEKANFEAMTPDQVYVDSVKHKTFIEVNEEGTEAAGVTSVGVGPHLYR